MRTCRLAVLIPLMLGATPGLSIHTTQAALPYSITDLGAMPGGGFSMAWAINGRGQIVGEADTGPADHAFLYDHSHMSDLGTINGCDYSAALAISDTGQVVGLGCDRQGDGRAFLYDPRTRRMTDLGTLPGGTQSGADAISAKGTIVGWSTTAEEIDDDHDVHAVVWDPHTRHLTDLGTLPGDIGSEATGVNDDGAVVGISSGWRSQPGTLTPKAFLYQHGKMTALGTLPGGTYSVATAINDSGEAVGYAGSYYRQQGCLDEGMGKVDHAFVYRNGTMTNLGVTDMFDGICESQAYAINRHGDIVGAVGDHAFLHRNGTVVDLERTLGEFAGWSLLAATGINDRGQIVGYGYNPAGAEDGFLLNPTD